MKLQINYIDHQLEIVHDSVLSLEIENKRYFYRLIKDLNKISNGEVLGDICLIDKDKEVVISNKISLVLDFFNFNFINKKEMTLFYKFLKESIDDWKYQEIINEYQKLYKFFSKVLGDIDLPIQISEMVEIEDIFKLLKISINFKDELLDNLLLMIDFYKTIGYNKVIVLVNLKQYLSKEELIEFFKYCVYNEANIVLIDSQSYGDCLEYERKFIIDDDLDEYVVI